ncbi:MAG: TldD/PmbA family protein, partial [Candidatus Thorarchaeota archaeon]
MRDVLRAIMENRPNGVHLEIRYHQRKKIEVRVDKGVLRTANSDDFAGVGIRALADGAWGYASTSKMDKETIRETLSNAITSAKRLSPFKKEKIQLAPINPISEDFSNLGKDPFINHGVDEVVELATNTDKALRAADKRITGSLVLFDIPTNHRIILNSDGTDVEVKDSRPSFYLRAVASEGGKMMAHLVPVGMAGGWEIFKKFPLEEAVEKAVDTSIKLLDAPLAQGGKHVIVMEPSVVGLISHEAIGHTVEADIVLSGSAAKGMIGEQVASEHVTLVDSGEEINGAGWLAVDDAGVKAGKTVVIEKGILKSYLHSRTTAHHYGVEPTGNERAYEYDVEPLIRMRNTYLEPGEFKREELIEDVKFGYLLVTPGGGQA